MADRLRIGGQPRLERIGAGTWAIERQHGVESGQSAGVQKPRQLAAVGRGGRFDGAEAVFETVDAESGGELVAGDRDIQSHAGDGVASLFACPVDAAAPAHKWKERFAMRTQPVGQHQQTGKAVLQGDAG